MEPQRKAKIEDVARAAGISPLVAARALSTPDKVSPETIKHVREAIGTTGYVVDDPTLHALQRAIELPPREEYYIATVASLRVQNGRAKIAQIEDDVAQTLNLSAEAKALPHGNGPRTQFQYDLAWVRTYLKWAGAVENPERGVWQLTPIGNEMSDDELRGLWSKIVAQRRADRIRVPKIPKQGPGPHFAIEDGILAFAKTIDNRGNDVARLSSLQPVLMDIANSLVWSLAKHEGLWPALELAAQEYKQLISQDLAQIDFGRLFGHGIILVNAVKAAKADQHGNAYPLAADSLVYAESLLELHGPFLLGSKQGHELISDAERFGADEEQREKTRTVELALARALAAPKAPVTPDVKRHIDEILTSDQNTRRPDQQSAYRGGLVLNASIVLVGAGAMMAVAISGAFLPALAGLVVGTFGKEAIKNSATGKEINKQLTNLIDGATIDFVNDNEPLLRDLAKHRRLKWLNKVLDWSSAQCTGVQNSDTSNPRNSADTDLR
jgi:hypothetical protein